MLTKNFYSWVFTQATTEGVMNGYIDWNGNTVATLYAATNTPLKTINTPKKVINDTSYGVLIGSGTTPPKGDDHDLESPITTGFDVRYPSAGSVSREADCIKWSATYAITNTNTAPLTICEIGLFGEGRCEAGTAVRILCDRTVLEAPIVIEPGQCKQVTYTIQFDYPA